MTAISDLLTKTRFGEPLISGSMFAVPLFAETDVQEEFLTLDEAFAQKLVEVSETSEDGSVPELVVGNGASQSVFLLDGEQVLGLKQNRTFNLSMVLPPYQTTVVPVSCLERGRWSAQANLASSAEHVHFAKGRAKRMESVSQNLRVFNSLRSDQGQVWADIDEKFSAERESCTSAEADFYAHRRSSIDNDLARFAPQPHQVGVIFGANSKVIGFDLFGSAYLFARLGPKLVRSYLLEADEYTGPASPPAKDQLMQAVSSLFGVKSQAFDAPGLGETHRWSNDAGNSAALIVDGKCVHAVGFCSR